MRTYQQTIKEIYGLQEFAIKLGLENIEFLCERLNRPETHYPIIHIAGTNGKGSTAFYLAAFLQAHGLKTGLFTSPHLRDYRERIRVNDALIDPEFIVDFWSEHKQAVYRRKATFFDTTTALGFAYFARQNVDVAVIETGLGGRLDSTNIVKPEIVVLTPIDFDHQKQLGHTLGSIAREKAGIIKDPAVVFCAPQPSEALDVFLHTVSHRHLFNYLPQLAEINILRESLDEMEFRLNIKETDSAVRTLKSKQVGDFQAQNMALAILTARHFLAQRNISWNWTAIEDVLKTKIWPGRLQTIQTNPRIIFDVSHNVAGIQRTVEYVQRVAPELKIHLLLGLLDYKDHGAIVAYLSRKNLNISLTEPNTYKKLSVDTLEEEFIRSSVAVKKIPDPFRAFKQISKNMSSLELLLVMGSHYLIGDLLNRLGTRTGDLKK